MLLTVRETTDPDVMKMFFVDGCQQEWDEPPMSNGSPTVGIDGGYYRFRSFERISGGWFKIASPFSPRVL